MENVAVEAPVAGEKFIPFLREDLIERCLGDGRLPDSDHQAFREFCSIFAASTHFKSHREWEELKMHYAPFDPDSEFILSDRTPDQLARAEAKVAEEFRRIAESANFRKLTREEMAQSIDAGSLITLKTAVDLDEFDQVECFVRGGEETTRTVRNWRLQKREVPVQLWQRVLLLIKFKPDGSLTEQQLERRLKDKLPYSSDKIYGYVYKDVPKLDLEILFPNVRVSMNLQDRLLIGVPAFVVGVATIAKIGVKLALVIGLILFAVFGVELFGANEETAQNLMKVATAVLAILVAFGGFGFKQWNTIKNKRIGFLKEVSEHLFFRNIAMNASAFSRMIDSADSEDCKEALLVYYHLLTNRQQPMTRQQLDTTIEQWMDVHFGAVIDFDIDDPIEKLKQVRGRTNAGTEMALLVEDENGYLNLPSLTEAKEIMDYRWDRAFDYSVAT